MTADQLIVIGRGRLIADTTIAELPVQPAPGRPAPLPACRRAGRAADGRAARPCTRADDGALAVTGLDASAIGDLAASRGIAVHALIPRNASLEEAYLDLTGEAADFRAASPPPPEGAAAR